MFVCTCSFRGPHGRLALPNELPSLNKDFHFTSLQLSAVFQKHRPKISRQDLFLDVFQNMKYLNNKKYKVFTDHQPLYLSFSFITCESL